MSSHERQKPDEARVIPLRPAEAAPPSRGPEAREPLWRDVVGDVLRRERLAQERTLKDVADAARISMPYLSELERGRKEASSEVLAAAAHALGLRLTDVLSLAQGRLAASPRTRPARTVNQAPRHVPRTAPHQGEVRLAA
ncbi:XRE family transcriptional regulator OS=Streptomyces alboniger OX=132473 GN=CP975_22180 PE=4 SV=1 [Streptomyces alboniger]